MIAPLSTRWATLVHLLRNAVDHGLEDAEERIKKGKNPVGKIFLEAHHEGSHVVVSVRDDGRGMDPQAIKERALMKKIISEQEAEKMSDEEALHLIFRGGFSTSEKITDVSGRGVGMDVVKTSIEALNGTVEIKLPGKRFPVYLVFRSRWLSSGRLWSNVERSMPFPLKPFRKTCLWNHRKSKRSGRKVITLRKRCCLFILYRKILVWEVFRNRNLFCGDYSDWGEGRVYCGRSAGPAGSCNQILGNYVNDIKGIAGATVLGDGRVTLILDVASLLDDGRVNLGKKS